MKWFFNMAKIFIKKQQYIQIMLIKLFLVGIFLHYKISNFTLILLTVYWIISGNYKYIFQELKVKKILIILIGFYALHIIGLLYSDNLYSGYKELEKKIPMLLLPLVIGSIKSEVLESQRKNLFYFYVTTTIVACLVLVINALCQYAVTDNSEVFYFKSFTRLISVNPIYLSIYVLFAFCVYFYELEKIFSNHIARNVSIYIFTLIMLILISSKNSLVVFIGITFHLIFVKINLRPATKLVAVLSMVGIIIILINAFPVTRDRIIDLKNSDWSGILEDDYTSKATSFTGTTLRISFWKITLKEMSKDGIFLFGVGTGDSENYLNEAYDQYGLLSAGFLDYNLHNAFMEVLLEFGVLGLMYYLFLIISIFVIAVRKNDGLLLLLVIFFCSFSLTESVLNINKGIAFFSFFYSFLIASRASHLKEQDYLNNA